METRPTDNPLMGNKIVNLADVRAARMAQEEVEKIHQHSDGQDLLNGLTPRQRVWWVNQQYFAERMASAEDYGPVKFTVGQLSQLDGASERYMRFECGSFTAFIAVNADWTLNHAVDPICLRWSHDSEPPYPVFSEELFTFTEETE